MPRVSLDGLQVAIEHRLDLEEAQRRVERAAQDLSEGSLARQQPVVTRTAPERLVLTGGRGTTRFEAEILVAPDRVTVEIRGGLELSFIDLTFAGGASGVRRRVHAEVERVLGERLQAA
ncbi:polyhydroxyalkanoic acid system family protein [bacterium]|nr:polyhydroxyalkanoic acid system family protein [bacterium]